MSSKQNMSSYAHKKLIMHFSKHLYTFHSFAMNVPIGVCVLCSMLHLKNKNDREGFVFTFNSLKWMKKLSIFACHMQLQSFLKQVDLGR